MSVCTMCDKWSFEANQSNKNKKKHSLYILSQSVCYGGGFLLLDLDKLCLFHLKQKRKKEKEIRKKNYNFCFCCLMKRKRN